MIQKFSQTYFFKYKFFEIIQFIYVLILLGFNLGGRINRYIFSTIQILFIAQIVLFIIYRKTTFSVLKNIKYIILSELEETEGA